MTARVQRCILLRSYPQGMPRESDFELVDRSVAALGDGQVRVEVHYLSLDPAPRLRMNPASRELPPMPLGGVIGGRGIGAVSESRHSEWRVGDVVAGELGWQECAVLDGAGLRRVDPALGPAQASLGVLGPSGVAAWCLVEAVAAVQAGEAVVIAAAAGAVGSVAAQLARLRGARVVALVASAAQLRFVQDHLGAASALDCSAPSFRETLAAALPAGADVFLDSVGGAVHEAVVEHIAVHGRIVAFGYISAYNAEAGARREYGRIFHLIHRRATLRGFLVSDHSDRFGEAQRELAARLRDGSLSAHEAIVEGLDRTPAAFAALFTGDPIGKQLVRLHVDARGEKT